MKKPTKSLTHLLYSLLMVASFSCGGETIVQPGEDKKSDFDSHEEYLINPSIKDAINESGISINTGDNPPVLVGDYNADGKITDASSIISELIDVPINSRITLYNQTNSGKISFRETVGGFTVWGSGGFITGDNGKFTVWQESAQSGEEAGLPDDITIHVALLMSGNKRGNGDLRASGISIITKVETSNSSYDTKSIEGLWWMWVADLYLQGGASLSGQSQIQPLKIQSINEIISLVITKMQTNE